MTNLRVGFIAWHPEFGCYLQHVMPTEKDCRPLYSGWQWKPVYIEIDSAVEPSDELPESLRDPIKVMEKVRAMSSESPLAAAIRIARGDAGPPDEPVRFASSAPVPLCECLLIDKTPSAYHATKCPRFVADKL